MLLVSERKSNKNSFIIHAVNSVLVKRWQGHNAVINKLTRISEPASILSCSYDKNVKIWSL